MRKRTGKTIEFWRPDRWNEGAPALETAEEREKRIAAEIALAHRHPDDPNARLAELAPPPKPPKPRRPSAAELQRQLTDWASMVPDWEPNRRSAGSWEIAGLAWKMAREGLSIWWAVRNKPYSQAQGLCEGDVRGLLRLLP
jgi:hypothetical protein